MYTAVYTTVYTRKCGTVVSIRSYMHHKIVHACIHGYVHGTVHWYVHTFIHTRIHTVYRNLYTPKKTGVYKVSLPRYVHPGLVFTAKSVSYTHHYTPLCTLSCTPQRTRPCTHRVLVCIENLYTPKTGVYKVSLPRYVHLGLVCVANL